jgi:uncharacterized membrane protein YoaK (UPF0700 family)
LRPRVAIALGAVAGFVDAVGFIVLFGLFTANQSGNAARLGVDIGEGDLPAALTRGVPVLVFLVGVTVAVAFADARREQSRADLAPLLMVEAGFVLSFMVAGTKLRDDGALTAQSTAFYVLAAILVLAMALQNAALRRVAGVAVHTTFVTGMLTNLAEDLAALRHDPPARARALVHGGVVVAYVTGAAVGAALEAQWELWCLVVPVVALVLIAVGSGRPIRSTKVGRDRKGVG